MSAAAIAAAVAAQARKRVLQSLCEQSAYTPATAAPLDMHRGIDRRMLARLERDGIVIENGSRLYHLDLNALNASEARSRKIALAAAGVLSVGAAIGLLAMLL